MVTPDTILRWHLYSANISRAGFGGPTSGLRMRRDNPVLSDLLLFFHRHR